MTSRTPWFLAFTVALLAVLPVQAADIRIKVSNKVLSNKRSGDTRSTQRHLKIQLDNRDREAYDGVTMEWIVIARDIRNRKLSIASSGSKPVHLPANEKIEVNSGPYALSKTEGKIEEIRENRNRPDRPQYKVDPDSGTRYAGYIVVLKKGEEILAEAATAGMKKRVQPLLKNTKK